MSGAPPPTPALELRGRRFEPSPAAPLMMGVLNASPESFFDGGRAGSLEDQVERGRKLLAEGADLLDVGGESGVSDLPAVSAGEEAARVVPLVERLAAEGAIVSVDTWKAEVARAALAAGAAMVNDPSGLREPELAEACGEAGAGLVVTHTRAVPKEKAFPGYADVVADVVELVRERVALAHQRGVGEERIVVDPGPDLAKTPAETVTVLRALGAIGELGRPVLLAVSRKDFIGALTGRSPAGRLGGTLAAVAAGLDAGASILRVHDVAAVREFLAVRAALRGEGEVPPDLALPAELRREPPGR